MRCFIAIELPEKLHEYISTMQKKIEGGVFSFARGFHLTLKFLGDIDEKKLDEVRKRLSDVKEKNFEACLSNIGFFPNEKHARVVWVSAEPKENFIVLSKKVEESLKGLFPKDDFVPHVTLVRVKAVDDKEKFLESIKSINIEKRAFCVNEFKLMKSTLLAQGPVYEEIGAYSLP